VSRLWNTAQQSTNRVTWRLLGAPLRRPRHV
jgi:hypothetical protein